MCVGAIPLVTPSGAMSEKIGSDRDISVLHSPDFLDSSLKEGKEFDNWVSGIIEKLKKRDSEENIDRKECYDWYEKYNWNSIAKKWMSLF